MANNDPNDVVTLIRLTTDDASYAATRQKIAQVKADLASINASVASGNSAASTSTNQLNNSLNAQVTTVRTVKQSWDEVTAARLAANTQSTSPSYEIDAQTGKIKGVADAWQQAADRKLAYDSAVANAPSAQPSTGGGGFLDAFANSRNSAFGQAANQARLIIPSVRIPGTSFGTDTIFNLARLAPVLAGIVPVVLPIVAAVGTLIAVTGAYNNDLDKQIEKTKALGNALNEAFSAGTTTAIESLKKDAERKQADAEAAKAILVQQKTVAPEQLSVTLENMSDDIGNFLNRTAANIQGLPAPAEQEDPRRSQEGYNAAIEEQQKIIDDAKLKIEGYNVVLGLSGTYAKDAAAEITHNQELAANSAHDRAQAEAEAAQFSATATVKATDDKIAAIQSEIAWRTRDNEAQSKLGTDAAEKIYESNSVRIQELNTTLAATEAIRGSVAARESEQKSIEDQLNIIQDSIKYQQELADQVRTATVAQTTDRLAALQSEADALKQYLPELEALAPQSQKAADDLADAYKRLGQIQDDYADQISTVLPAAIARAAATLTADIAKIETATATKVASINADEAAKEVAIRQATNDKLSELATKHGVDEKRAQEDLNDAIRELQEKAALTEKQAVGRRDAVSRYDAEQQEALQEKQQRRAAEKAEKRRDEDYDTALKQLAKANEDQIAAARTAANKQISEAIAAGIAEENAKRAAYAKQLADLNQFTQSASGAFNGLFNTVLNGVGYLVGQVAAKLNGASSPFGAAAGAAVSSVTGSSSVVGNAVAQALAQYPATTSGASGGSTGAHPANTYHYPTIDPNGSILHALGYAGGGKPTPNDWFVAGEDGPELVRISRPSTVYNRQQTHDIMNGGQRILNLNLNGLQQQSVEITSRRQAEDIVHNTLVEMGL